MKLTKTEREQLNQVRRNEPVYVKDLISKVAANSLVEKELLYRDATGCYCVSCARWNNVARALSELYEVYYASGLSYSEDNMYAALECLMKAYSEWLD